MALTPRGRILMAAILAPLAACAGADSLAEPGLDGPDRPLTWEREVVHTVGGFDATDWDAFGDVGGVGFDAAGNLYILDTQAFSVSVVSPQGEFIRSFGAQGEGYLRFSYANSIENIQKALDRFARCAQKLRG